MGERLTKQQTAERRVKALNLRATGASYATVTAECGYGSEAAARRDVSRCLEAMKLEAGRNLLTMETIRSEAAHQAAWALASDPTVSARDRVLAIREVTRVLSHRLRLLGLDRAAAERHAHEVLDAPVGLLAQFRVDVQAAYAELPSADDPHD